MHGMRGSLSKPSSAAEPRVDRFFPIGIPATKILLWIALITGMVSASFILPAAHAQSIAPAESAVAHAEALKIYRSGERSRALARVDKALSTDAKDTQLRFLRGVLLTELGRRDDAIVLFRQMIQDFPELPEPYNNLAVLQASGGDLDSARETLEAATRVLPSYGLAHENLGDIYLRLAQRAWEHAEFLNPAQAARVQERLSLARDLVTRDLASRNLGPRSPSPAADPPKTRYLRGVTATPTPNSNP